MALLQKSITEILFNMKKELLTYIVIGVGSVVTDYLSYLIFMMFIPTVYAKTLSYVVGMIFGFFCNRTFTFKSNNTITRDALYFFFVYMVSLLCNVAINEFILFVYPQYLTFAFVCATGVSIVTNYLGQKFLVYRK
ncbi:MAG: hypothetical protein RLZZ308_138 [Candidatus Parcubacteria bacterium]|jgi:putative flippase GtrA